MATLHRLKAGNVEQLEKDLTEFARTSPITLVLPALYSEFEGESLRRIPYLSEIVVALARAQAEEFAAAKEYFSDMPQPVTLIWNDGPRIGFLYKMLQDNTLHVGGDGKGRSCWLAFGYVQARGQSRVIALHDCDITTYNRELLARLCYPVADPFGDFAFCKGYYARARDRLYGRVTRARHLHPVDEAQEHPALDARRRTDHSSGPRILRLTARACPSRRRASGLET